MRRTALVVVGGPVLVGVLGVAVFPAIRSDLPDPVATHWGRSGPWSPWTARPTRRPCSPR